LGDSCIWDFGDGTLSYEWNPIHTYQLPGIYAVDLTVYNGCGNQSLREYVEVSVNCELPHAEFEALPDQGQAPLTVSFTNSSLGDNCTWDFGDGTVSFEWEPPTHTYMEPGGYWVLLVVHNDCGSAIYEEYIDVCAKPYAYFKAISLDGNVPLTVNFTNNSVYDYYRCTGVHWDFGDSTGEGELEGEMEGEWDESRCGENATHTYKEEGSYEVCLTLWNDCGESRYCQVITVDSRLFSADGNLDGRMSMAEAIGYLTGWQQGINPIDYAIRAVYLWQGGEKYRYDPGATCPLCWVLE